MHWNDEDDPTSLLYGLSVKHKKIMLRVESTYDNPMIKKFNKYHIASSRTWLIRSPIQSIDNLIKK